MARRTVVLSFLGTTLDAGFGPKRWHRWRPNVALAMQGSLKVDKLVLFAQRQFEELAQRVVEDLAEKAPDVEVEPVWLELSDAWDFEEVYGALLDFARGFAFKPAREDYLVHITTGTHVAQICLFLLTEARYFPAKLLQTSPPKGEGEAGYSLIDLDLSRYDTIASRFTTEKREGVALLKSGIATKNAAFNKMIARIEEVSAASRAPMLLLGPTGAGKSQLARRIFELKQSRQKVEGSFVEVNCATLRGDAAMSALFGHQKGAFTGAVADRPGLLRKADRGVLFLDEIGELGLDEQAMLLRAIEEKVFYPVGSDREVKSDFQLVAGTNRDLEALAAAGDFRSDLLARINLWTFRLPALRERTEDVEPNLDFELVKASRELGRNVTMSREARARYLEFATSNEASWPGNFRDLDASMVRMATLAKGGRITVDDVDEELVCLRAFFAATRSKEPFEHDDLVVRVLGRAAEKLDRFDRAQLADVLAACRDASTLSDAGRLLFAESRKTKSSANDADRLRKYLARFETTFADARARILAGQIRV